MGVVAGDTTAQALLTGVVRPRRRADRQEYPTAAQATDALDRRTVYAILTTDGSATAGGLSLTLSGAAAPGATEVIGVAISAAAGTAQVPLTITDVHPLSPEDPRGLTAFYTVVGLLVGGYLAATALAIVLGTVPRSLDRLGLRLSAFGVFALLLGLAAALLTRPAYDIWSEHFVGLWLSGALIAFVGACVHRGAFGVARADRYRPRHAAALHPGQPGLRRGLRAAVPARDLRADALVEPDRPGHRSAARSGVLRSPGDRLAGHRPGAVGGRRHRGRAGATAALGRRVHASR